eukprot:TRINITY_DN7386_c0_g1_i1.p1 TRINITY_DN7386_c0_g1~~TRINITY_DN7386_c0_g1_i1.p1  ORF type:complete len:262 (+),score=57.93 TRINITY_DN7386_c0_g1_i1:47-787(+)
MEERCLVMWVSIVLNEFKLDSNTVKCLTLVSRCIANEVRKYIQQNYWFDLGDGRRLTYYLPYNQKQVRSISEITLSTKRVVFHDSFNEEVDNLLQLQLTHIEFSKKFNKSVSNKLPHSLISLKFGFDFNVNVTNLPPNLTILHFGACFTQPISTLPHKITQLIFDDWFNEPLSIYNLPFHLTHLELGVYFRKKIPSLPPKVQRIIFGPLYCQKVSHLSQTIEFQQRGGDRNTIIPYRYTEFEQQQL